MDTPTAKTGKGLSLFDIHRAIETMSISQALTGIAVVALLKKYQELEPDDAATKTLIDSIDRSVGELRELALSVMDIPYDS